MKAPTTSPEKSNASADWSALKERATAACRRILARAEFNGTRPASKEDIRAALTEFAADGLLDFAFLDPAASVVVPRDLRKAAAVLEALAGQSGALASIYMVHAIVAPASVTLAGTPAQKAELLPRVQRGELQLAFALSEPEAGSDAASLTTTAEPDGAGGFVLTGEKMYTTGAATAEYILVVARVGGTEHKRAFSVFLVPAGAAGVTIEPLDMLAGGAHASCRVRLERVRVGPDAALGGAARLGTAWDTFRLTGAYERLLVAALALGLASAIVARATEFARQRRQFGQPIASFQTIQYALVDLQTGETAMRLFVEHALAALEAGGDATQAICSAKYFCAEQLQQIAGRGIRVLGGRAYFGFEDMTRYYREAPFSLYAGGTVEVQKMLIARMLGLA